MFAKMEILSSKREELSGQDPGDSAVPRGSNERQWPCSHDASPEAAFQSIDAYQASMHFAGGDSTSCAGHTQAHENGLGPDPVEAP
jgi:hypothetical protein